jgi:hypothetical protein
MSVIIQTGETEDIYEITIASVPFSGTFSRAYWGWMGVGDMITEAQIIVLQGTDEFDSAETIIADFRGGNATPQFLFMAERSYEPIKTKWHSTELAQGDIAPEGTFMVLGVVSGWRVYRSQFKTQFSTVTEFRTA